MRTMPSDGAWAQTTMGLVLATLGGCAPPPEDSLAPMLGSGPPLSDTGDLPTDDPGADDANDDGNDDAGADTESDTTAADVGSGDTTATLEDTGDESGTRGATDTGDPCPPAQEGCPCTLDGTCAGGLACVEEICEPARDPGPDPCASGMYGDGPYCGESIGGTAETLYLCTPGVTTATSPCDFGCASCDPFEADVCKAFAGQSDAAACE